MRRRWRRTSPGWLLDDGRGLDDGNGGVGGCSSISAFDFDLHDDGRGVSRCIRGSGIALVVRFPLRRHRRQCFLPSRNAQRGGKHPL